MITGVALTAKINAARKEKRLTNIGCGQGLILRVTAAGKCSFIVRYRKEDGRYTNKVLGEYTKLTLASARERARKLIEASQPHTGAKAAAPLFGTFADERIESIRQRGKNGKRAMTCTAFRKALAPLDNFPINEITMPQAVAVIGAMNCSDSKKYHTAKFLIQLYNEAIQMGVMLLNPVQFITKQFKRPQSEGYSWVPLEQLQEAFWVPLLSVYDFIKYAYLLIALTGLRLSSALSIEWAWVDFEEQKITIPGEHMKTGKAFTVPITPHLKALLLKFKEAYPGPSQYVFYHWSVYNHKINTFESLPLRYLQGPVAANCGGRCTIHGLRKTLRTWMAKNGVNFDVGEACLAHEEKSSVVRAYQKYDFFDERMKVMSDWGEALLETLPEGFRVLLQ